jgi:hypothetical protein
MRTPNIGKSVEILSHLQNPSKETFQKTTKSETSLKADQQGRTFATLRIKQLKYGQWLEPITPTQRNIKYENHASQIHAVYPDREDSRAKCLPLPLGNMNPPNKDFMLPHENAKSSARRSVYETTEV